MAYESEEISFIVLVRCGGRMCQDGDGQRSYAHREDATKRAQACAAEGEYAEVRQRRVTTKVKLVERFEAQPQPTTRQLP